MWSPSNSFPKTIQAKNAKTVPKNNKTIKALYRSISIVFKLNKLEHSVGKIQPYDWLKSVQPLVREQFSFHT